jgi:hypothetical protein
MKTKGNNHAFMNQLKEKVGCERKDKKGPRKDEP